MSAQSYNDVIIDGHCHLASTNFIPREFYLGLAQNLQAKMAALGVKRPLNKLIDAYLNGSDDHQGDRLVREMDSAGISQSVLLLPDFTHVMESEFSIAEMYQQHRDVLENHRDRFFVFAGVDPRWGKDGLDLFERGVRDYGFSGLKLYPPCGYSASDKRLYPFYEICKEMNLPVLLHTGPTSPTLSFAYSDPWLIDEAALNFPTVNFILAHGAVNSVEDTLLLCAYRANVYTDVSAFMGTLHPQGWKVALNEVFRRNLNHKIIFGTDWPLFQNSAGQKKIITEFCSEDGPLAGLSDAQKRWLMSANIQRLIGVDDVQQEKTQTRIETES